MAKKTVATLKTGDGRGYAKVIKMCNAMVKCCVAHVQHVVKIPIGAEIMPQSQRHRRKQQSTGTTAIVFHFFISFLICLIHLNTSFFRKNIIDIIVTIQTPFAKRSFRASFLLM